MQNPKKVFLSAAVLIILYSAPGWSESNLKLTQQETQNEIIKLKENIEKDYRNIKSLNDLGAIYLKLGKYEEAIKQFKKALEVDPNYTIGPFLFGNIYTDAKNYQEKINDFKDVIKTNREYARAHNYLGLTYLKKKNYSAAKNSLLESIKVNPKYAKANNNLGVLYEKMGDTAKAIESYQMAQRIDPKDPDSFYNLGLAYDNLKDGDNSVRYMVLAKKAHEKKFGQEGIERISKKLDQLERKYTDNNEVESVASLNLSSDDEVQSPIKTDINQASIVSSAIPSLNSPKIPSNKSPGTIHQTSGILSVNLKPKPNLSSASVTPAIEKQIDQKESTTENTIGTHHNQEKTDPNAITNIQDELIADAVIKEKTFTDPQNNLIQTNFPSKSEEKTDITSSLPSNPEKQVIAHKKKKKTWASDWVFEYPK
tara:strand:+ start:968 stop:2242 length:1275 start_codon:yes stop_codon:yes gene_type:complete